MRRSEGQCSYGKHNRAEGDLEEQRQSFASGGFQEEKLYYRSAISPQRHRDTEEIESLNHRVIDEIV